MASLMIGLLSRLLRRRGDPPREAPPAQDDDEGDHRDERREQLADPERPIRGLSSSPFAAGGGRDMGPASILPAILLVVGAFGALYLGWPYLAPLLSLRDTGEKEEKDRPLRFQALPADDAVLIDVRMHPRKGRLLLDGEPAPSNPLRLPRGNDEHVVTGMAEGYQSADARFRADRPQILHLRLKPTRR